MTKPFLSLSAALIALGLAAAPGAAEPLVLSTAPEGPQAVFTFERDPGREGVRLGTRLAGVAGSRVTVSVDRSPRPVLSQLLTAADCSFPDGAASVCEIAIDAADPTYDVLLESFRLGREAHVRVETGGVMEMDHSLSLLGFTRAIGAQ